MDDLLSPMEARRRSRSKTPFLRSSCDNEACAHAGEEGHIHKKSKSPLLKKHPNITAIIEESNDYQSTLKNTRQQSSNSQVNTTSDYSSNSSEDLTLDPNIAAAIAGASRSNDNKNKLITKTTTTSIITKTISNNINNNNSKNGKTINISSNISSDILPPSTEISQNEINTAFERSKIQSSTPKLNKLQVKNKNQNVFAMGLNEDELKNHRAYQEYKEAGEYWLKYPKTDYTYSTLSPHRREIEPGVVAMPNMSRKSLEKHNERVNFMIEREPAQEEYIRRRYEATSFTKQTRSDNFNQLLYDSQDEVDLTEFDNSAEKSHNYLTSNAATANYMYYETTWITRLMTIIVTCFTNLTQAFLTLNTNENYLYRSQQQKQGFFGRLKTATTTSIWGIFSYFYMLISAVLFLDTCILRSSSADSKNKKRFLLFLLILMPLLILAVGYNRIYPSEPFPPINFSQLSDKLPTLPTVNLPQFVDSENFEILKENAFEKIANLRLWSEDYFDYLKNVSQNVATETKKVFLENFNQI